MDIIKKHSRLYREIPFETYNKEIIELSEIKNKDEFIEYILYFQIDINYLIEEILNNKYLEYLIENEEIKKKLEEMIKNCDNKINDNNYLYLSKYIEITNIDIDKLIKRILKLNLIEYCKNDNILQNVSCNLYMYVVLLNNDNITYMYKYIDVLNIKDIFFGILNHRIKLYSPNIEKLNKIYTKILYENDNRFNKENIIYFYEHYKYTYEYSILLQEYNIDKIKKFPIQFIICVILNECMWLDILCDNIKNEINNILEGNKLWKCDLFTNSNYIKHKCNCGSDKRLNDKNLKYISKYIQIKKLNACSNENITTVEPFGNTIETLNISCFLSSKKIINDDGIKYATNLKELWCINNNYITTLKPFENTLQKVYASDKLDIDLQCVFKNIYTKNTNIK